MRKMGSVGSLLWGVFLSSIASITANCAYASALNYDGGTYTQDFDGLPTNIFNPAQAISGPGPVDIFPTVTNASSTLTGWQIANPIGNVEFKSQDGSLSGSGGVLLCRGGRCPRASECFVAVAGRRPVNGISQVFQELAD